MTGFALQLEKWFWRIFRLGLILLALPFALMMGVFINGFRNEGKALERARGLPAEQRQAIVQACVRIAGTIQEEHDELVFGERSRGEDRAIPAEFLPLQPMRVNVRKDEASIKLHFMVDSGVFIYIEDLDSALPVAKLSWGEMGDHETWVVPWPPASPSQLPVKSGQ